MCVKDTRRVQLWFVNYCSTSNVQIERNIVLSVKKERRTRGHGVILAKKQCRLYIIKQTTFTKNS